MGLKFGLTLISIRFIMISIPQLRWFGKKNAWHGSSKGASPEKNKQMKASLIRSVANKVVLATGGSPRLSASIAWCLPGEGGRAA